MICLAFSTQYPGMTDRRRRTSCDTTVRAMRITSRGKNCEFPHRRWLLCESIPLPVRYFFASHEYWRDLDEGWRYREDDHNTTNRWTGYIFEEFVPATREHDIRQKIQIDVQPGLPRSERMTPHISQYMRHAASAGLVSPLHTCSGIIWPRAVLSSL